LKHLRGSQRITPYNFHPWVLTLSDIGGFITITQLDSFMDSGGSTRWDGSTEAA